MADLSPEEVAYFAQQRRRIEDTFGQGVAQNAFETTALGGEKTRQMSELVAQLDALRQSLAGDFARGGTLNSGLYQKAVADFETGATRQKGLLEGSFADRLGALNLAKQQLEQSRGSSLADIDQQEAARRAQLAASITAALSGGGGVGSLGGGRPTYSPGRSAPRTPARPSTPSRPAPAPPPAAPRAPQSAQVAARVAQAARTTRSTISGGY